jgi:hypothetical protein
LSYLAWPSAMRFAAGCGNWMGASRCWPSIEKTLVHPDIPWIRR